MGLNPMNVGWGKVSVGYLSPVFDGSIELWRSKLVVMVGIDIMEDLIGLW
jgi:hypothetical protein